MLPMLAELIVGQEEQSVSLFSKVVFMGVPVTMLIAIILGIRASFRFQPLRGILGGDITFEADRIKVINKVIALDTLSKVSFGILDYEGMKIYKRGDLNGSKSRGVNNSVILYIAGTREPVVYYFQLLHKNHIKNITSELIAYHLAGKLHFLNLIDVLGISRYEEIQEFKKLIYSSVRP